MKNIAFAFCFCIIVLFTNAQNTNVVNNITNELTPPVALAPLRFLASDELMGRATARPEINIAARYISEQFRSFGLKEMPATTDYFQTFNIQMRQPTTDGSLMVNGNTYKISASLIEFAGGNISINAPVVYVKHGTGSDLSNIDVKGKVVITEPGADDAATMRQGFAVLATKRELLQNKGAVAIVERFKKGELPWVYLQSRFTAERAAQGEDTGIPAFIVNDEDGLLTNIPANTTATLNASGAETRTIPAKNVLGYVEGTDPKLKNQYIVLSAHYDHLGVASQPKMEEGKMDSIYNGARDNAIGTTAVIDAAQYFAQHPPKRSVLFMAYTAEEIGEIGSKYFSEYPPVPLKQIVYNLNIDNASYNDTSIVSVIGLGRTSADNDIKKACAAFNLTAKPDPAPEQNLFDRSDNVNLAVHGIPAPTFSLGIDKFDNEINKRYHQLSDEVGNFNLNYALKYIRSFILAAQLIADDPKQPEWIKGDKYEAAWKQLYQ